MSFSTGAIRTLVAVMIAATGFSAAAKGAIIFDSGITALANGSPVQLGRISRNGVVSDWSAAKPFPGEINTTISYHYTTYDIPINAFPFIQISFDDISGGANTFIAAYLNSYNPTQKALNYLGDPGGSGNFFGTDPEAFQVIVPLNNDLILVVNDASATGAGVGQSYRILVEGFSDTDFDEVAAPEPRTWSLNGAMLIAAVALYLRHKKSAARKDLICD
jgi:hypothetical protein